MQIRNSNFIHQMNNSSVFIFRKTLYNGKNYMRKNPFYQNPFIYYQFKEIKFMIIRILLIISNL
jgi:hypothetical protein